MAVTSGQVVVLSTTDGVLVAAANPNWRAVGSPSDIQTRSVIINNLSSVVIYLGAVGVTSATGYAIAATTISPQFQLAPDESISARAASGTQTVAYIVTGT